MVNIILYGPTSLTYTIAYLLILKFQHLNINAFIIEYTLSDSPVPWCGTNLTNLHPRFKDSSENILNDLMRSHKSSLLGLEEVKMTKSSIQLYNTMDKPPNRNLLVKLSPDLYHSKSILYHPVIYTNHLRTRLIHTNRVSFATMGKQQSGGLFNVISQISKSRMNQKFLVFNFDSFLPRQQFHFNNQLDYIINSNLFNLNWFGVDSSISHKLPNQILWTPAIRSPYPSPPTSPSPYSKSEDSQTTKKNVTKQFTRLSNQSIAIVYHFKCEFELIDLDLVEVLNLSSQCIDLTTQTMMDREIDAYYSRL